MNILIILNGDGDMAGTGIMAGICTSPYPYPYLVNVEIPRQNGTGSGNTHRDMFICHL